VNQRLTHFDVRLNKDAYVHRHWDKEHRDRFLLTPEIEWPLSIDPLVWPSVFFSEIFREATELPYGDIEVDPRTDDGKYWLSLEQMKAHYEAHRQVGTSGVFVAIHLFSEQPLVEDMIPYVQPGGIQCALALGRTNPRECPPGSEFLGYDVADASWISGLANCGYTPDEKQQLGRIWASRLNSFGLLKSLDDATEFRQLCDARVPEHSPFWIYGISRLAEA